MTQLAGKLEDAILEIVIRSPQGCHQDSWGGWGNLIRERVTDFTGEDLKSAFKRLHKQQLLRLTKWDGVSSLHPFEYSSNEADDRSFFFFGRFNAVVTDEGRACWEPRRSAGMVGV